MDARPTQLTTEGICLPASLYSQLLPAIDDLAELKLLLYFYATLAQREGRGRYVTGQELRQDSALLRALATEAPVQALERALQRALQNEHLLQARLDEVGEEYELYFPHDDAGKRLQEQARSGQWRAAVDGIEILPPRPTLFAVYEANFGLLTPLIADSIKEAQALYPPETIEKAMRYAVERNARNWRYVSRVLESWQREGKLHAASGRNLERHQQYTIGEWQDFIES